MPALLFFFQGRVLRKRPIHSGKIEEEEEEEEDDDDHRYMCMCT